MEMTAQKLERNVRFTVLARLSMIVCAALVPVSLALGGFLFNRFITAADKVADKLDAQSAIVSEMNWNVRNIKEKINDHETRLRQIERASYGKQ